jgi:hypothetical protein
MSQIYCDGRIFASLNDLLDFLRACSAPAERRSHAYRGQSNQDYQLAPRLFRVEGSVAHKPSVAGSSTTGKRLGNSCLT